MIVQTQGLAKRYSTPGGEVAALSALNLEVEKGRFVAVVGRSGSGKSTLLHLLGGIDRPSAGYLEVGGQAIGDLDEKKLAPWRGRNVGFVFQFFQLLPTLTVAENVVLPMDFCDHLQARERRPRALALLERVGLADMADRFPAKLSGGQQQRVAIARALANDPPLLLADEPTGNLDSATAGEVFALFRHLASEGKTVLIATHERDIAALADESFELVDGRRRAGR